MPGQARLVLARAAAAPPGEAWRGVARRSRGVWGVCREWGWWGQGRPRRGEGYGVVGGGPEGGTRRELRGMGTTTLPPSGAPRPASTRLACLRPLLSSCPRRFAALPPTICINPSVPPPPGFSTTIIHLQLPLFDHHLLTCFRTITKTDRISKGIPFCGSSL